MTMCSQLLTIKRYTIYVLVSIWLSIDSEAAIEITLAGLKQPFCFCSVHTLEKLGARASSAFNDMQMHSIDSIIYVTSGKTDSLRLFAKVTYCVGYPNNWWSKQRKFENDHHPFGCRVTLRSMPDG